jgi:sec-independent protein translocase protein TatB
MGPKELPNALKTFAFWIRKLRGMAREFQSGVDQLIREAELEDAKKKLQQVASININREIEKAVDPDRALQSALSAPSESKAATTPAAEAPVPAPSIAPPPSAEVKPFPAPNPAPDHAGVNGAVHVNGAGSQVSEAGVAIGVASPAPAVPETNDEPEASASRKALG